MCGITGWVSFRRNLRYERPTVRAMTETMSCRGPDDEGIWIGQHVALGHRRLAVIDPPGGRQPMTVDTGNGEVAIVYSGEAYNYTELRAELGRRGHRFRTDSDTEVVLHAYLEWGAALASRLNGMYAFAIWDSRQNRLIMVRDRMGIKPFYYYEIMDGVLFGSEPKPSWPTRSPSRWSPWTACGSCSRSARRPGTPCGTGCARSSRARSSP